MNYQAWGTLAFAISDVVGVFLVANVHLLHTGLRFGSGIEDAEADDCRRSRHAVRGMVCCWPLINDGAGLRLGIVDDVVFMDFRPGQRRRGHGKGSYGREPEAEDFSEGFHRCSPG